MCAHPRSPEVGPDAPFLTHDDGYKRWAQDVGKSSRRSSSIYGTMTVQKNGSTNDKKVDHNENKISDKSDLPDGGWGWLVVLGVSMSNMTTQALVSVFGFLFSQRLAELNIATSGAAVILSVQSTFLNLSGLLTGVLIRKYSYQRVAISGALLMMSGLMLTTLANSLTSYILTYGVFTGLGLGFLYPSTFVAVNSYFSTKKGIAVGWSVTGTGVGQMLLPLLVSILLEEYGFRGTILILAALSGHSLVGALLYQPVSWHMKNNKTKSKDCKTQPEAEEAESNGAVKETKVSLEGVADMNQKGIKTLSLRRLSEPRNRSSYSLHSIELDDDDGEKGSVNKNPQADTEMGNSKENVKSSIWSKLTQIVDWDLLKSGPFLLVVIGAGIVYTANTLFQMLFPLFLEDMSYTRSEVASCMMALSAFDIVGRPVLPYIVRFFNLRAKTVFFVSALLSAILRSVLATQSEIIPILILSATCGLFRSAIITNMNLTVAEETSVIKLPAALGLQMVGKGVASMALGPLVGVLRDSTHSFVLCIHVLDVFFLGLPFVAWLIQRLCTKTKS